MEIKKEEGKRRKAVQLSEEEKRFCACYAELRNPEETAARCGITPERARAMLCRPELQRRIHEYCAERFSTEELKDSIIAGLKRLAFCEAPDFSGAEEDGGLKRALRSPGFYNISEAKFTRNGVEFKFYDRLRALQALEEIALRREADEERGRADRIAELLNEIRGDGE